MTIYKKVKLNEEEKAFVKARLKQYGESYRSWVRKRTGKRTNSTGDLSNYLCKDAMPFSYKTYKKIFEPLNLPFLKDFKWEEEE